MSPLEERYRGLLRVLPRWYRAQREDEMVTAFLAGRRDPDDRVIGWPGWPETRAVLALAVTTRVAAGHGSQRAEALGRILRLTALLGLVGLVPNAVAGVTGLVEGPDPLFDWQFILHSGTVVTAVLAGACLILLVTHQRRLARRSAAIAIALSAVIVPVAVLSDPAELYTMDLRGLVPFYLPLWVATGSVLVAFTREAPVPRARPWLIAAAVAAALAVLWTYGVRTGTIPLVLGDLIGWAVLLGALVLPFFRRRLSDLATWASAVALTAAALIPERVNYVEFGRQLSAFEGDRGPLVAGSIQLAGLVAAVMVLGAIGVHHYRRLAAPSTPATNRS
jgi:hypothetical protein